MNIIKKILAMTGTMFFGGLLILGVNQVFAEMNGMQGHQHTGVHKIEEEGGSKIIAGIKTEPERITVGTPTTIVFSFKESKGKPAEGLTIHHDRLIHVIIASQDFGVFAHIHPQDFGPITPEMKKTALYPVLFTFQKAGRYIVGIDFAVNDSPLSKHFVVDVAGEPSAVSHKRLVLSFFI